MSMSPEPGSPQELSPDTVPIAWAATCICGCGARLLWCQEPPRKTGEVRDKWIFDVDNHRVSKESMDMEKMSRWNWLVKCKEGTVMGEFSVKQEKEEIVILDKATFWCDRVVIEAWYL